MGAIRVCSPGSWSRSGNAIGEFGVFTQSLAPALDTCAAPHTCPPEGHTCPVPHTCPGGRCQGVLGRDDVVRSASAVPGGAGVAKPEAVSLFATIVRSTSKTLPTRVICCCRHLFEKRSPI